jgi:hypothetical protein
MLRIKDVFVVVVDEQITTEDTKDDDVVDYFQVA